MNCKRGDLARVIDCEASRHCGIVDRFVVVTNLRPDPPPGCSTWCYEGPMLRCACGCSRPIEAIDDRLLRPVRDPGDDAVDETLQRLPAPREAQPA